MKSITINGNTYTADRLWYAVQRDEEDEWGNGSEDYDTAVEMLRAQGHGLIAVIDDCENPVCLAVIYYADLFDDEVEMASDTSITINGKAYGYIFDSDENGVYVRIGDGEPVYATVADLKGRWGEDFDAEKITEEQWDALEAELKEKAIYALTECWTVFEANGGEVYLEATREELDALCARCCSNLCRVSGSRDDVLISYIPSAQYPDDRKYWRLILNGLYRRHYDWRLDYARIARIRDEEAKEREQK